MSKSYKADALSNEFQNFLADLESLLKETTHLSGEELSQARDKIRRRVESAKESVVHLGSEIAEVAATANHEVHEEPWKAIGAGAAVGLLLGLLFARR